MAQFNYIALDLRGKQISGSLDAETESIAVRLLDEKGLSALSVTSQGAIEQRKKRGKVRRRDIGTLYGQLADLLGSGVPLLRAFDSLIKSPSSPAQKELLQEIRASIAEGKTLTDSLKV